MKDNQYNYLKKCLEENKKELKEISKSINGNGTIGIKGRIVRLEAAVFIGSAVVVFMIGLFFKVIHYVYK